MKKLLCFVMVFILAGCSAVRFSPLNKEYSHRLDEVTVAMCDPVVVSPDDGEVLLSAAASFYAELYDESKIPLFGSVYLSPAWSELISRAVDRSYVDAEEAPDMPVEMQLQFISRNCQFMQKIQDARDGNE